MLGPAPMTTALGPAPRDTPRRAASDCPLPMYGKLASALRNACSPMRFQVSSGMWVTSSRPSAPGSLSLAWLFAAIVRLFCIRRLGRRRNRGGFLRVPHDLLLRHEGDAAAQALQRLALETILQGLGGLFLGGHRLLGLEVPFQHIRHLFSPRRSSFSNLRSNLWASQSIGLTIVSS